MVKSDTFFYDLGAYTIIATMFFGILYGMLGSSGMPDVHVSYSTKECVRVINYYDEEYTCENYPRKYNHIWVE